MFKIQLQHSNFAPQLQINSLIKRLLLTSERAVHDLFFDLHHYKKQTMQHTYNNFDQVKQMLYNNHMIATIQYNNKWSGDPLTPYNYGHLVPMIYINYDQPHVFTITWTVSDPFTPLSIIYRVSQVNGKPTITTNTTLNDIKW